TSYYHWFIGIIGFLLLGLILYYLYQADSLLNREMENYITTLSYRLKKVGEEALMEMPIGIMLFNDDYIIEWTNPFLTSYFEEDTLVGRSIYSVAEAVIPLIKQEINTDVITV